MKTILTSLACLIILSAGAQSANSQVRSAAYITSLVKINPKATPNYKGNLLLNRVPASPVAAAHDGAYKGGVALLVLGPLKMVVGIGFGAWAGSMYHRNINNTPETSPNSRADLNRGVAFGAALSTFHILTGAALTAGGIVLIRKSHRNAGAYLTIPEPTMASPALGYTNNAMGLRTSIVF
ncbi:MAG: hypothetical protein KA149_02190 [Chitinophagales bacterium]|nr:hypothetical protein [Chitinophagales bacterium]